MTHSERIRHPSGALDPPQERGGLDWRWIVAALVVAFFLVAVLRPQWLARIGIHVTFSDAAKAVGGAVSNPMGWV